MRGIELQPPQSKSGIEYFGKLRLDIFIDADGVVDHVDAGQSTVPPGLRGDAIHAFSTVRWEPGRIWGVRVKSVKHVEVDLAPPPGVEATPTQ